MLTFKKTLIALLLVSTSLFAEVKIGDKAYDFSLPCLTNDEIIKMDKNNLTLVNVWASWCKGCKKEMPFLHSLSKKYKDKNFEVITINIDKKKKSATKFMSKLDGKLGEKSAMTCAYDKEKSVAKTYAAKGVPFSLLIKNGIVVRTYTGSFDESNEAVLVKDIEDLI